MIVETEFNFGAALREIRLSRGLTQTSLSDLTGIPQNRISNWELGYHLPNLNDLRKLCIALHCPPGDLLALSSSELTAIEYDMIKQFRQLDDAGQHTMLAVLESQIAVRSSSDG